MLIGSKMAFESALIGRVHLVQWSTAPDFQDILRLVAELGAARRVAGEPLVNLTVVPDSILGVPEPSTRKEMLKNQRVWADNCEAVHVVLKATGFRATLARAVIAEIVLVMKRGVVTVYSSVDGAIAQMAKRLQEDPGGLRRRIGAAGVIEF